MNIYGWIFMIFSWVSIIILNLFAIIKILKNNNNSQKNGKNHDTAKNVSN